MQGEAKNKLGTRSKILQRQNYFALGKLYFTCFDECFRYCQDIMEQQNKLATDNKLEQVAK
jgi:hypothetical protein